MAVAVQGAKGVCVLLLKEDFAGAGGTKCVWKQRSGELKLFSWLPLEEGGSVLRVLSSGRVWKCGVHLRRVFCLLVKMVFHVLAQCCAMREDLHRKIEPLEIPLC